MGNQPLGPAALSGRADRARAVAGLILRLHAFTAATALAVWIIPGIGGAAAAALNLKFEPRPGTVDEAAAILLTNTRVIAAVLLLGVATRRGLLPHRVARGLTNGLLAVNASLVGAAIGAYGLATTAPWLLHVPLEWTALAVAAATLQWPLRGLPPGAAAAIAGPLLATAAITETYATPVGL